MLPVGIIKIPFRSVFYGKKVISKKFCFWRAPIAHSARQFENNFIRKKPFFRKKIEISKVRARCAIGARQSILNFYIVYLPCKTRRKGFMVIFSESMFFWRFLDPSQKTLEKCYFRPKKPIFSKKIWNFKSARAVRDRCAPIHIRFLHSLFAM